MKIIVMFTLFLGMFLIMNGIYEQKLKAIESSNKTNYKFIPRTLYEDQVYGQDLSGNFASIFGKTSPWFDQVVGSGLDVIKSDQKLKS